MVFKNLINITLIIISLGVQRQKAVCFAQRLLHPFFQLLENIKSGVVFWK